MNKKVLFLIFLIVVLLTGCAGSNVKDVKEIEKITQETITQETLENSELLKTDSLEDSFSLYEKSIVKDRIVPFENYEYKHSGYPTSVSRLFSDTNIEMLDTTKLENGLYKDLIEYMKSFKLENENLQKIHYEDETTKVYKIYNEYFDSLLKKLTLTEELKSYTHDIGYNAYIYYDINKGVLSDLPFKVSYEILFLLKTPDGEPIDDVVYTSIVPLYDIYEKQNLVVEEATQTNDKLFFSPNPGIFIGQQLKDGVYTTKILTLSSLESNKITIGDYNTDNVSTVTINSILNKETLNDGTIKVEYDTDLGALIMEFKGNHITYYMKNNELYTKVKVKEVFIDSIYDYSPSYNKVFEGDFINDMFTKYISVYEENYKIEFETNGKKETINYDYYNSDYNSEYNGVMTTEGFNGIKREYIKDDKVVLTLFYSYEEENLYLLNETIPSEYSWKYFNILLPNN